MNGEMFRAEASTLQVVSDQDVLMERILLPTGTAFIHAQPDDYRSEPAASAGDRIACGVIGLGASKTTAK